MSWLRGLKLVLIINSLAVFAEIENASEEVPRIINEQDIRLLINPLNFLNTKTTTTTTAKPKRPQYPYPNYPRYPYYPYYPPYPYYPHVSYYPHYPPHPTKPTHPSTHSTKPSRRPSRRPSKRPTRRPSRKPSRRPHSTPASSSHFLPPYNGYYPWPVPTTVDRQPLIFYISPSGFVTTNAVENNNNNKNNPGSKEEKDRDEVDKAEADVDKDDVDDSAETAGGKPGKPKPKPGGGKPGKSKPGGGKDKDDKIETADREKEDRMDSRYYLRNSFHPYTESAIMDETLHNPEEIYDDHSADYDYESAVAARNIQPTNVSIVAVSEEDNNQLPLDIHLSSRTDASHVNNTLREQEALIYLKNFKIGRKLKADI